MEKPYESLVSVVIPAFNVEAYVEEAIQSVFGQTYPNYEIIVVDDGSTDNTRDVLKRIAGIRYFEAAHRGPAAARNLGIREAKGEYIAFLDADDLWLPEKLAKQVAMFRADDELAMVFSGTAGFDENGMIRYAQPIPDKGNLLVGDPVKNIFLLSNVGTPSVMVRRAVLDEVGLFEERLTVGEDDNLWMRIAAHHPIALLKEVLVHCRSRHGSLTRTEGNFLRGIVGHIDLLETKYPELYQRLGRKAMDDKLAFALYAHGCSLFAQNRFAEARNCFWESFHLCPRRWSFRQLIATFIPSRLIVALRNVKGRNLQRQS